MLGERKEMLRNGGREFRIEHSDCDCNTEAGRKTVVQKTITTVIQSKGLYYPLL